MSTYRNLLRSTNSILTKLNKFNPSVPTEFCCGECAISSCIWNEYATYIILKSQENHLKQIIFEVENPPQKPKELKKIKGSKEPTIPSDNWRKIKELLYEL